MVEADDVVCVTRYCPNCGTEIFCRSDYGKHRVFYLSEDMTDPTHACPQCEFNLISVPFELLLDDPDLARERRLLPHRVQTGRRLVEEVFRRRADLFKNKAVTKKAVDAVGAVLFDLIAAGEGVRWSGLGSFKVQERRARRGRDPRTGKELRIPAKKTVRFRPVRALKERLNK